MSDGTGRIVFVGTGFSLMAQATPEAVREISRAQRLLYLVADPATARWLTSLNASAESLANHYALDKPRTVSYEEMTERILGHARQGERVCVAFYGHPGVGCEPLDDAGIRRLLQHDDVSGGSADHARQSVFAPPAATSDVIGQDPQARRPCR